MLSKRRMVVISIAAIIVIAAIVTVLLVVTTHHTATKSSPAQVTKDDPSKADPSKQEAQTKPDLSKDLGACTAVTKATIVSAIGTKIEAIGDAVNRGYAKDSTGTELQTCTFALASPDVQTNRYSTTVTDFNSDTTLTASKTAFGDMTKVDGIGDAAYYGEDTNTASTGTPAVNTYNVYVFSKSKLYTLTITQPADSDVFTSTSAQSTLTTIAKTLSL